MRTFVYQKERRCRKRRNMMRRLVDQKVQKMPEEGEESEKVRESESEKVAEPLLANKKRIKANKLSPEANTFSRGKVMVNL